MHFLEKLKRVRGIPFLLLGLFLGVILLLLPTGGLKTEKTAAENEDMSAYEEQMEHKIAQMVSAKTSSEEVFVLVTADCSEETVYAAEGADGENGGGKFLLAGGSQPVPVRTVTPKIRGIAVVCRGGDDPALQLSLISMLTAAFGLPASHVYVGGK